MRALSARTFSTIGRHKVKSFYGELVDIPGPVGQERTLHLLKTVSEWEQRQSLSRNPITKQDLRRALMEFKDLFRGKE